MINNRNKNISIALKKYYSTHEHHTKGKSLSKAHCEKLSKNKKEYYLTHKHFNLGKHLSNETKEKISKLHKNKKKSKPHKDKLSKSLKKYFLTHITYNKGKNHSKESKQKMSESHKKYYLTHDSHNKGKSMSDEQKKKISISKSGDNCSAETRKKMSISAKKKWKSSDYRKQVKDTNVFFNRYKPKPTKIELLVLAKMLSNNIFNFVQEYRIERNNGKRYYIDFMIFPNLMIECDGDYWHSLNYIKTRDKIKNKELTDKGWNVLRFSEKEIHSNLNSVINHIKEELVK